MQKVSVYFYLDQAEISLAPKLWPLDFDLGADTLPVVLLWPSCRGWTHRLNSFTKLISHNDVKTNKQKTHEHVILLHL